MAFMIPGTVHTVSRADADHIEDIFASMFMAGDLALRNVAELTGLASHDIQNWVKRGFLSPPQRKRYNMNQVCRILNINMLRTVLPMETICGMLSYINGHLDDTSDDTIRDSDLYFIFVQLASSVGQQVQHPDHLDDWIADALEDYPESIPGAKVRIQQVLKIMLTAWAAAQLRSHAESMVGEILYNKENGL
jgi:DNA-binding transcriptional MerR regulator